MGQFHKGLRRVTNIWMNTGDGAFHESSVGLAQVRCSSVTLGDLDGDGDLDAFLAIDVEDLANQVWLNGE